MRFALLLSVLLTSYLVGQSPVAAQMMPGVAKAESSTPATPQPVAEPSPNDLRELMRLLDDDRIRVWLRRQALAQGQDRQANAGDERVAIQRWLALRLDRLQANAVNVVAAWSQPGERLAEFQRGWNAKISDGETLRSLVYVIVFLIIGTGLEWLYWRYAWGIRRRIETQAERTGVVSARDTATRALLVASGIALFALGATGGFLVFDWAPLVATVVISLLLAVILVRLVNVVARFILCPGTPALRLLPIASPVAKFVYRWTMALVIVACVGGFAAGASREAQLLPEADVMLSSATATIVALMLIVALWHGRAYYVGATNSTRRVALADLAPVAATLLVIVAWALWLVGATALMATLLAITVLPLADFGCRRLIRASVGAPAAEEAPRLSPEQGSVDAALTDVVVAKPPRRQLYAPVLERLARFVLVVAAVLLLGIAWGLDLSTLSTSTSVAGRLFEAAVDVLVAVLIADLLWVWAKTAIDNRLADYKPPEPGHAPGPEARLATLLPLIRKVLMITLLVMVTLVFLSSLGINVGPLLAGAGVVGIAIGFGAQTLVRDIVSGIFFLLDDAFRVGEYIEIGDLRGTVESISVRSLRLRHHRGAVHTIPFGEMKSLTNHSRDWVIMKLEFRVPFGTDLKVVKKIVKAIGEELAEDEEIGPSILEPLKSQGVRRMEEFNMVVGVKFMTKPGEQWQMRKEVYQRVRDAFEAKGITFAERNVKVEVVGAAPNSPEAQAAALGAAEEVMQQQRDQAAQRTSK